MKQNSLNQITTQTSFKLGNSSATTNGAPYDASLDTMTLLEIVVLLVTLVAGFFGNALVVGVVLSNRQMRTRTNIFLTQLAITGMGVCLFCIPFMVTALIKQSWVLGEAFCKLNAFVVPFWFALSIFTLTVISVHKYFSIVHPLKKMITHDRSLLIIIVVWLSAFACAIGPILGWTEIVYKPSSSMCGPSYPHNASEMSHTVFLLCCVYLFPVLAMTFLYWRIARAVKLHCQRIRDTAIIDDRGILAQKKIIITLVFVVAAFVACWTPFFIYGVLTLVTDVTLFSRHFLRSAYICGFLHSVCTPIILGARNPRFRRGFKELVTFRGIRRNSLSFTAARAGSSQCESPRRPSSDYLAEKRCSVWFLSSQNSLLSLEPEPTYRRRKLRWIETYL